MADVKKLSVVVGPVLDLSILGALAAIVYILFTGGGAFDVLGFAITVRGSRNPLILLFAAMFIRYWVFGDTPFLFIRKLDIGRLPYLAANAGNALFDRLSTITLKEAHWILAIGLLASLVVRCWLAWVHYGFAYADEVEVHQMALRALGRADLPVWDVRGAFHPMVFVFPAQWLMTLLGVDDVRYLVFAGRMMITAFSLVNMYLSFAVGRVLGGIPVGLLAFFFVGISQIHIRMAVTALPRTIATTFLLLAFLAIISSRQTWFAAVLAGLCMGIGTTLRLGEAVFFVPFSLHLFMERRFTTLMTALVAAAGAATITLGFVDLLYWPDAFHGVRNMLDFAVVNGLSSSGYDPPWAYLRLGPAVLGPFICILFLYRCPRLPARLWLWGLVPVLLLSAFQKKEDRYLLPVSVFIILGAAWTVWQILHENRDRSAGNRHVLIAYMLLGATAFGLSGSIPRTSESAIDVARWLASAPGVRDVAMEAAHTTTGASLYLPPPIHVVTIDGGRLGDRDYLLEILRRQQAQFVVLYAPSLRSSDQRDLLGAEGYFEQATNVGQGQWIVFERQNRQQ